MGKIGTKRAVAAAAVFALGLSAALVAAVPRSASPYREIALLARVLAHIERSYVEEVDGGDLLVGAAGGMVRALDPHSSFLRPEELEALTGDTKGRFGGVGLEVGVRDGYLTVIAPIEGGPAARAGIEPGDRMVAVEGRSTRDMGIDEVVLIMRGEPGTEVTATFLRPDAVEPFDVTFTREVVEIESVEMDIAAPGLAHLRIRSFQEGTAEEVESALGRALSGGRGLDGLVVDLRRNPGGLLEEAVRVADLFLSSGEITITRGRGGAVLREYRARRRAPFGDVPLVVLVDGASASAAEIVAGAIKDRGRGAVVGTPTFGKASVQSILLLEDGYGLKLTTARYFTPAGRDIQAEGVLPDVVVEAPLPDGDAVGEGAEGRDPQLLEALRLVRETVAAQNGGGGAG